MDVLAEMPDQLDSLVEPLLRQEDADLRIMVVTVVARLAHPYGAGLVVECCEAGRSPECGGRRAGRTRGMWDSGDDGEYSGRRDPLSRERLPGLHRRGSRRTHRTASMTTSALAEEVSAVTSEEFAWFQDYFGRKTGIYFEDNKRYFVDRRLTARMQATGHKSCLLYLRFVQFQPSQSEYQKLVNAMTVNETYFFREEYQLSALVDGVMDDVRKRKAPGQSIRIWSMPCSTGEEPYSIAIYLMEHWPGMAEADVEIVGSDINSTVLDAAREGVFTDYALRNTPPHIVAKYFKQDLRHRLRASPGDQRGHHLHASEPDQPR
jgi:hypothetical protein